MRFRASHKSQDKRADAGFTLAELLVSTVIVTIVLTALYTAYSSSIRLWRLGEADLHTYQDARTSLSIMTRELQNIVPGASYLTEGAGDEIEFIAVVPSMDVEESVHPRALWIKYRLKQGRAKTGDTLIREERVVESPLPAKAPKEGELDRTSVELGRDREFEMASNVKSLALQYYWVPPQDQGPDAAQGPPAPTQFIIADELPAGKGLPQGVRIDLTLLDPNAETGNTLFSTYAVFRGPTTQLEEDSLEKGGGLPGASS